MAFYLGQGFDRKISRNVIASAAFRQAIAYMRHGGVLTAIWQDAELGEVIDTGNCVLVYER